MITKTITFKLPEYLRSPTLQFNYDSDGVITLKGQDEEGNNVSVTIN